MRITVDTNVLREANDPNRNCYDAAMRLLELQKKGEVEIQVTTRFANDVPREPLKSRLASLPIVPTRPGGPWRVGYTAIGNGDAIASERERKDANDLMELLFPCATTAGKHHPNRIADIDHLLAHRKSGAVKFISIEKAIIENAGALRSRFGIDAVSPSDFLEAMS